MLTLGADIGGYKRFCAGVLQLFAEIGFSRFLLKRAHLALERFRIGAAAQCLARQYR